MVLQKIFLFGLDNAGKTSLSQAIRTGKATEDNKPTKAFDIKELILRDFDKNIEIKIWDAPGQVPFRKTWGRGMEKANILMFVVDTADANRFPEAKRELDKVIQDMDTRSVPLVCLFHKMDLEDAQANLEDARAFLKLPLITERDVYPLETSVNDPDSIDKIKTTIGDIITKARW